MSVLVFLLTCNSFPVKHCILLSRKVIPLRSRTNHFNAVTENQLSFKLFQLYSNIKFIILAKFASASEEIVSVIYRNICSQTYFCFRKMCLYCKFISVIWLDCIASKWRMINQYFHSCFRFLRNEAKNKLTLTSCGNFHSSDRHFKDVLNFTRM